MSEVCKEVRFISQLALDGIAVSRIARDRAYQHRETCAACMNFHQTIIQATALASDLSTEEIVSATDLTAVSQKLRLLVESVTEHDGEDAEMADDESSDGAQPSIESRLQALLGPRGDDKSATASADATGKKDLTDGSELVSSVEKDGRLIETWVDKGGWTSTRIRWITSEKSESIPAPDKDVREEAPPSKQGIFNLSESDIDNIFGRMYTSRSRENKRRDSEAQKINPGTSTKGSVAGGGSAFGSSGFSVSHDALAQLGKISPDKLDKLMDPKGCIRDIGKFLLDPDAVNAFEKIIKSAAVNSLVNRLTTDQAAVLERLQSYIHAQHSVAGTLVLGRDGIVLSARYRSQEFEDLANWALCAYVNSKTAAHLLNSKHLHHIILSNQQGDVIITDLGQTFLITVTEAASAADKDDLISKLENLIEK